MPVKSSEPIPIYNSLSNLFNSLGTSLNHAERWNNLAEEFVRRFGRKPGWIARAPGRVNIIGEHIDYCLFGVLPAAVEQDILIACAPRSVAPKAAEGSVIAENLHTKYTRQTFMPVRRASISTVSDSEVHVEEWHMDINTKELRWESYVKAGYFGVLNHYFDPNAATPTNPIPVDLLVTGTVPAGSGLSSSAAMVVASTLAFLAVNGKLDGVTKFSLVEMAVENEKRVGVNSGGMDQAASVTSIPSSALYTTFFSPSSPTSTSLSTSPVPLLPSYTLIVANSLIISDKAVTAKTNYNLRVVETLVGARILAKHLSVPLRDPKEKIRLREVLGRWVGEDKDKFGGDEMPVDELERALQSIIPKLECLKPSVSDREQLGVTKEEMIKMAGMTEEEFDDVYLSWVEVEATHFQLYKRALHVYSEALRVLQFRKTCLDAARSNITQATPWPKDVVQKLGEFMNDSQTSCSQLCQSSCPEVDLLVEICRKGGAVGSRVTGAGWGGCTVSLVPESLVPSFIEYVTDNYAPFKEMKEKGLKEQLNEAIFATKPSNGACVYKFEE